MIGQSVVRSTFTTCSGDRTGSSRAPPIRALVGQVGAGRFRRRSGECLKRYGIADAEYIKRPDRFGWKPDFVVEHQQALPEEGQVDAPRQSLDIELPRGEAAPVRRQQAVPSRPVVAYQQADATLLAWTHFTFKIDPVELLVEELRT